MDTAAVLHSFEQAATQAVILLPTFGVSTPDAIVAWQQAATFWHAWCGSAFLRSYLEVPGAVELLPKAPEQRETLLRFHLMAEAVNDLERALLDGGQQAGAPLEHVRELLGA